MLSFAKKTLWAFIFTVIVTIASGCLPMKTTTFEHAIYAEGASVSMVLLSKGGKRIYLLSPEGSFPEWGNYLHLVLLHPKGQSSDIPATFEAPGTLKSIWKELNSGTLTLDRAKRFVDIDIISGEKAFNGHRIINEIMPLIELQEVVTHGERLHLSKSDILNLALASTGEIAGISRRDILLSYLCSLPGDSLNLHMLDDTPIGILYIGDKNYNFEMINKFDESKIEKIKIAVNTKDIQKTEKSIEELRAEVLMEIEKAKEKR